MIESEKLAPISPARDITVYKSVWTALKEQATGRHLDVHLGKYVLSFDFTECVVLIYGRCRDGQRLLGKWAMAKNKFTPMSELATDFEMESIGHAMHSYNAKMANDTKFLKRMGEFVCVTCGTTQPAGSSRFWSGRGEHCTECMNNGKVRVPHKQHGLDDQIPPTS